MHKFASFVTALLILSSAMASDSTRLEKAQAAAASQHRYILLNFSGSDWCIPCIKMKKMIFDTDTFRHYVAEQLVWMNADFPRSKKNLSKADIKQNEQLAEQYNKNGAFPFTVLLDEKGSVIKTWDGFPGVSPETFLQQVDSALNDYKRSHSNSSQKSAQINGQPF